MFRLFRTRRSRREALIDTLGGESPPSFPRLAMEAMKLLRNPDVSMGQVGRVITADPGLSTTMLRTVNSASSGLRRRVDSATHAVNLLGRRRVEGLVMARAVSEAMPRRCDGYNPQDFWGLSAERAALARRIARRIAPESTDLAFTAALLEDMSLPLLAHHRSRDYAPLMAAWSNREVDLQTEEERLFGWNHAQVAQWLGEEWMLSEALQEAIGSHHDEEGGLLPVKLVGLLRSVDDPVGVELLIEAMRECAGLSPEQTKALIQESIEESRELGLLLAA